MGGEGTCCGAGQRRSYILRIEKARDKAGVAVESDEDEGVVRLSRGGMPGDACDGAGAVGNGPLQLGAHGRSHTSQRHNVSLAHDAPGPCTPDSDMSI
jgi:hypothetical protein